MEREGRGLEGRGTVADREGRGLEGWIWWEGGGVGVEAWQKAREG